MNLSTVRDDLKARLATVSGLQTYDTIPAKPEVPCAVLQPASCTVHASFGHGSSQVRFDVLVLVQAADWPSAQDALDGYLSIGTTGSLIDTIETPSTGTEDVAVESWDSYQPLQLSEHVYGSVVLHVLIEASS